MIEHEEKSSKKYDLIIVYHISTNLKYPLFQKKIEEFGRKQKKKQSVFFFRDVTFSATLIIYLCARSKILLPNKQQHLALSFS